MQNIIIFFFAFTLSNISSSYTFNVTRWIISLLNNHNNAITHAYTFGELQLYLYYGYALIFFLPIRSLFTMLSNRKRKTHKTFSFWNVIHFIFLWIAALGVMTALLVLIDRFILIEQLAIDLQEYLFAQDGGRRYEEDGSTIEAVIYCVSFLLMPTVIAYFLQVYLSAHNVRPAKHCQSECV